MLLHALRVSNVRRRFLLCYWYCCKWGIVTPTATIRLSHGRLHQLAMRDPTDHFDLPDHLTWQMNMAIDQSTLNHSAQGILGETFVPTRDADGNMIMTGMNSIRGVQEDCKLARAHDALDLSNCSNNPLRQNIVTGVLWSFTNDQNDRS